MEDKSFNNKIFFAVSLITEKVWENHQKSTKAIYSGKRSKATVNMKKISDSTGLPLNLVDMAVGYGTLASLSGKDEVRKAVGDTIENHFKKGENEI